MRLLAIHLPDAGKFVQVGAHRGIADVRYIDLVRPLDRTLGWTVALRQGSVFVIVPEIDKQLSTPKIHPGAYEFARINCVLLWDSTKLDDYAKHEQHWTSEPLKRADQPSVPEVEQPAAAPAKTSAK